MVGITTATIIILLTGGGDVQHYLYGLKQDVKKQVDDKERRTLILDESKNLSKALKAKQKEIKRHFQDVIDVHSDFAATAADFDEINDVLMEDQRQVTTLILDARDAMHAQMTREEWNAVFQAPKK